ncbi:phasin family protein [Chitiniphilus purpureus]|uniref:Phasin family protein n=1 Tax=Chitiniphilus purpureus TaxID=2981137 RepID=A0ABY6DS39_9NEIS|nr:phasin family protein [Chitiniphilus sp. CD1]UXY17179.1 phasin family protein [Chitiniphilus sp. CD1]
MMFNANQLAEANQASLEKSLRFSQIAISGVERLMTLQLGFARDWLASQAQTSKSLSEVKDVQGLIALQRQLAQPAVDKTLEVARSVFDTASATQHEFSKLVEEQVLSFNKNLISSLDKAVDVAPAGAGAAVSVLRNAVETTATAYDTVTRTTQKLAAEFAQAAVEGAEQTAQFVARRQAVAAV